MWTCGIAIATQQEMLAMHNITVSALVESLQIDPRRRRIRVIAHRARRPSGRAAPAAPASSRRAQNMPMAIWVVRQPIGCTPQLTSGGQIVPPT